jgi:hypothetical protein
LVIANIIFERQDMTSKPRQGAWNDSLPLITSYRERPDLWGTISWFLGNGLVKGDKGYF